ncbi:hypothetical protein HYPSUDRAFT_1045452 [Hypholoma sublateritium FD-334 SS-4]|uniref:Uncharacterized protein n=1 Tax=Hypholoma sublateritium (strain FD-334 SS-4) TaxID=945553 RepID=A0A0D2NKH4_HYPSF|nr:hypothetical protein HYPSUDRAFT_1045452 [Hypholoma sublateritium FD-334 SS-4]
MPLGTERRDRSRAGGYRYRAEHRKPATARHLPHPPPPHERPLVPRTVHPPHHVLPSPCPHTVCRRQPRHTREWLSPLIKAARRARRQVNPHPLRVPSSMRAPLERVVPGAQSARLWCTERAAMVYRTTDIAAGAAGSGARAGRRALARRGASHARGCSRPSACVLLPAGRSVRDIAKRAASPRRARVPGTHFLRRGAHVRHYSMYTVAALLPTRRTPPKQVPTQGNPSYAASSDALHIPVRPPLSWCPSSMIAAPTHFPRTGSSSRHACASGRTDTRQGTMRACAYVRSDSQEFDFV